MRVFEEIHKGNQDSSFKGFRERHTIPYLYVMTVIAVILEMGFHLLDRILELENVRELLLLRTSMSLLILINIVVLNLFPKSRKRTKVHIYIGFYILVFQMSFLSYLTGGIYSAHWAGLTLILIFWMTLVPFSYVELLFHGMIFIVQYTVILYIFSDDTFVWTRAVECNFFFFGAYFIGCIVAIMNNKNSAAIFYNQNKLQSARKKSEELLLNILPEAVTERLKDNKKIIADSYNDVSIMFADIVNFTRISGDLSPEDLVNILNRVFSEFDMLTKKYRLEKIKTIGDAYMVIGGAPEKLENHTERMIRMAIEMRQALMRFSQKERQNLKLRIGVHSGPVVAGVIGATKFAYDLWGDTVNTASRMESQGVADYIQVTEEVYHRLKHKFDFMERGMIDIKGKGQMNTYLLKIC